MTSRGGHNYEHAIHLKGPLNSPQRYEQNEQYPLVSGSQHNKVLGTCNMVGTKKKCF